MSRRNQPTKTEAIRRDNRRQFLQMGVLATVGLTSLAGKSWAVPAVIKTRPPNFLVIISDQLSLAAISAHGCADAHTPNIDRLIARGTTFQESYTSNPVCSPARSSLFTGRMPIETGVIDNNRPVHASRPNMGQWLNEAGYETTYCGKWHLPNDIGMAGFHELRTVGGQGALQDGPCSRACESYLHQRDRARPFLLVSSFMNPHDICFWAIQHRWLVPEQTAFAEIEGALPALPANHQSRPVGPALLDRQKFDHFSEAQWRYYMYAYYRQVEMVDAEIGRVLNALDDTDQAKDTVVIFTADHGESRGRHLRVGKDSPYEEAAKVPLVFACPDRLPGGRIDRTHLVSGIDLMDTACDLAGVRPPKTSGRSLRPILEDRQVAWRDCVASEFQVTGRMLRTSQFKYVTVKGDSVEQLFDLQADPWETTNLYQQPKYADVLKDHRRMLADWEGRLEPVEPTPPVVGPKNKARQAKKQKA